MSTAANDSLKLPVRGRSSADARTSTIADRIERALGWASLLVASFFICAAAYHGFFSKWQFRDTSPYYTVKSSFDGDIVRPFAYRRLGPDITNAIDRVLPKPVHDAIASRLRKPNGTLFLSDLPSLANDNSYIVRYHLLYIGCFAATLLLLLALYRLGRAVGLAPLPAYAAAAAGVLCYPVLQSRGGYYYDFPELLFLTAFLLCALRGRVVAMLLLAVMAAWNKESFLFFVPTAYPFLRHRLGLKNAIAVLAGSCILAATVYVIEVLRFSANKGGPVAWHLFDQLHYIATLGFAVRFEMVYGMIAPQASSLIMLAAIAGIVLPGWRVVDRKVKTHITIAAAINIPLFLLFCAPGEMRNLSMLYPGFVLLIGAAVNRLNREWPGQMTARSLPA